MPRRQPPPRLLLMTDERLGEALWPALERLPRGAGVVFRHRATPPAARRALYERVRAVARRRGLWLLLAGTLGQAIGWRADGVHGPGAQTRAARPLLRSRPVHDGRALVAARRAGADLVLLSPVFATRSHPGARVLGPVRFGLLARRPARPQPLPGAPGQPGGSKRWRDAGAGASAIPPAVIALGGMTHRRFGRLAGLGAAGWAAIDGLTPDQNLKVVPR